VTDAYYDNVVLLLPFSKDAPGPTATLDYSKYKNPVTSYGSVTFGAVVSGSGAESYSFNGSTDYVEIPNGPQFDFGSGDATIEGNIFLPSLPNAITTLMEKWNINGFYLNIDGSNRLYGGFQNATSGAKSVVDTVALTTNVWIHVALVRSGSSVYLFKGGVLLGTATGFTGVLGTNTDNVSIGRDSSGSRYLPGSMYDWRITNGIARYTTGFTPPTNLKADCPYTPPSLSPRVLSPGFCVNKARDWSALSQKKSIAAQVSSVVCPDQHIYFGGPGTVTGVAEIGATPVKARVRIYEANSGQFIREMWSNSDGTYTFSGMRLGIEYTLTAVDPSRNYNDVIAARVMAV
jgi:Concanavalin A-like lectin/glucanases superfamily